MSGEYSLPELPSITKLSPTVVRILGGNPGQYTLQGTNTYLIGDASSLTLLDTAQGLPNYTPFLRTALEAFDKPIVADIVLSHWHEDHVGGIAAVLELLQEMGMPAPKVWKFPEAQRDSPVLEALGKLSEKHFVPSSESALHPLADLTPLSDLTIFHTPGHTTDSISLYSPSLRALFTADTVLGHGTAIFEDLSAYITSLETCIARLEADGEGEVRIYPGHGAVVESGVDKLREYVRHRMEREGQVVEGLRKAEGELTAGSVAKAIYGATIPEGLLPAATRGVLLHLEKLEGEKKVVRSPSVDTAGDLMPGWSDRWELTEEGKSGSKM